MKKTMILIALMAVSALMFGLTVDGYVTDADNGDAIGGAKVRFIYLYGTSPENGGNGNQGGNGGGNGIHVVSTITDENGYYIITDLEAGIYDALAAKPGSYPSVRIEDVELIEDTTIDFELTGGICPVPASVTRSSKANKI